MDSSGLALHWSVIIGVGHGMTISYVLSYPADEPEVLANITMVSGSNSSNKKVYQTNICLANFLYLVFIFKLFSNNTFFTLF